MKQGAQEAGVNAEGLQGAHWLVGGSRWDGHRR